MFAVAEPLIHPAHNVTCNVQVVLVAKDLVTVHVVLQQLRVVIRHLFEVGYSPVLVNRIAMEASTKLVVHATPRHFGQSLRDNFSNALFLGSHIPIKEKIYRRGVGKFRRSAEAPVIGIENRHRRLHHHTDQARGKVSMTPSKSLGVLEHVHGLVG